MAAADTARLLASLELQDKFTPTLKNIDRRLGAVSGAWNRNLGRALDAGLQRGVRAIGDAIGTGIEDLALLEDATSQVDGAIKQLGLTGQITSGQVAGWANEIEANVGAAFDDKAITSATATLLRFGKVTPANIRPAMEVMTDLAARTGDVDSAASLLAKALADPEKAAGKLARAGVVLTKEQQKQIKALAESGDAAGAQALLLQELEKTTKGAAAASQGPYRRSLNLLADASEDAKKALAEGFLPIIERVRDRLTKFLADPKNIERIREIGRNLAGAFDKAVTFVEGIDWKSIGDGLKIAADWASKLFDAFMSLPPEAKATIVALAGLNKLSGGAVSGIVGELGKGLIKGVLGMTAGVVNLKAGVVNGAGGGLGGATSTAAGATGKLTAGGIVAAAAPLIAVAAAELAVADFIGPGLRSALGITGATPNAAPTAGQTRTLADLGPLKVVVSSVSVAQQARANAEALKAGQARTIALLEDRNQDGRQLAQALSQDSDRVARAQQTVKLAIDGAKRATEIGTSAARSEGAATRHALRSLPAPHVNVQVKVGVAATNVVKKYTTIRRMGPVGGSRDGRGASGPLR